MGTLRLFMLGLAALSCAVSADSAALNPLFVFDNGTGRDQKLPLDQQADLVSKAGYAGIGYTGTRQIPELLRVMDQRGLQVFSIYTACRVDQDAQPSYDPGLPDAIRELKGRRTVVWLTVQGKVPRSDTADRRAAELVGQIADLAAQPGLRVVLYPHVGFYVERIEDALRIRSIAGRNNVGVTFNLAHFLAIGDEPKLNATLAAALPHLEMVSINGADHEGDWRKGDWSRLIQPLDRGEFDVKAFVLRLRKLGYKGPFGLQCYKVPGDIAANLKKSMDAWKRINGR